MSQVDEAELSFNRLRDVAASREITGVMNDGAEIVWCGEHDGEYVGWAPRELAEAKGYEIERTREDSALLALVDVAEAALALTEAADAAPIPLSSATAFRWDEMCRALRKFAR